MTAVSTQAAPTLGTFAKVGAIAGLVGGVVNLAVFGLGKAVGVAYLVDMGGTATSINLVQPIFASFIATLLGALLLGALSRSAKGITVWLGIAAVVFVAETVYAIAVSETTGTAIGLTAMHVVVLAVAVQQLLPLARRRAAH